MLSVRIPKCMFKNSAFRSQPNTVDPIIFALGNLFSLRDKLNSPDLIMWRTLTDRRHQVIVSSLAQLTRLLPVTWLHARCNLVARAICCEATGLTTCCFPPQVHGKCGSVHVRLIPAPRGTGIVSAPVPKKLLSMAGLEDCYTSARGQTATLGNFGKSGLASYMFSRTSVIPAGEIFTAVGKNFNFLLQLVATFLSAHVNLFQNSIASYWLTEICCLTITSWQLQPLIRPLVTA